MNCALWGQTEAKVVSLLVRGGVLNKEHLSFLKVLTSHSLGLIVEDPLGNLIHLLIRPLVSERSRPATAIEALVALIPEFWE